MTTRPIPLNPAELARVSGGERIAGTGGNDTIRGGTDTVSGGEGNDPLDGSAAHGIGDGACDMLSGEEGDDTLVWSPTAGNGLDHDAGPHAAMGQ